MKKGILATIAVWGLGMVAYANTILDPSFTSGFSSDYTQVLIPQPAGPGGQWLEGTYAINTDPYLEHDLWSSFSAPHGGNMMIVNGAVTAGENVWSQTIGSGTYDFSAFVANNYPDSPASLVLELNGTPISSPFSAPNPPGTWASWDVTFIAPNVEVLSIVDLNTAAGGNDFSLAGVPDGGLTCVMLGMAMLGLGWARRQVKQ
jgi:hypothetical protein